MMSHIMKLRTADRLVVVAIVLIAIAVATACAAIEPPNFVDAALTVELVAAEPEIVTPVSCRFDSRG